MSDAKKELFEDWPMKPMIILPPDAMSAEDIAELRKNHLCVVVAKDPALVKFVDPIPAQSSRTQIEAAAIKLSRIVLNRLWGSYTNENVITQSTISRIFTDCLVQGTPLDQNYVPPETIFDRAKTEEIQRLAREEAKAERAAAKAALTGTAPITGTRAVSK